MTHKEINEKNIALVKLIQNGNIEAEKELCELNKTIVMKTAKRLYKSLDSSLELEDLMQEGYIGLLEASRHFDLNAYTNFMNYAYYCMIHKMQDAQFKQGYLVKYPTNMMYEYKKFKESLFKYQNLNETERNEQIAKELKIPLKQVKEYLHFQNNLPLYSLNGPILSAEEEGQEVTLMALLPNGLDLEDVIMDKERQEYIRSLLNQTFDDRTIDIIRNCYKFEEEPLNGAQLAKKYNLSDERIRQIRIQALRKLRHANYRTKLKDFVDYPEGNREVNIMKFSTDVVKDMNKKGILSDDFVHEMESIQTEFQNEEPIKNSFVDVEIESEEEIDR